MMLVLLGLIVRAVSIAARNQGRGGLAPFLRTAASPPAAPGGAVWAWPWANLMRGLPLDARANTRDLLGPAQSLFALHRSDHAGHVRHAGACWLAMKTQGDLASVRSPRPYSPGPRSWPCTWMPRCGRLQTHPGSSACAPVLRPWIPVPPMLVCVVSLPILLRRGTTAPGVSLLVHHHRLRRLPFWPSRPVHLRSLHQRT